MSDHILLATDGSEYARKAAQHAVDLAAEEGASLHVLCVIDERKLSEPAFSSTEYETIEAEDHGHDCVKEVSKMAEGTGITVEGDVRHGVPSELILEYAAEIGADRIVIGEHGEHDEHLGGVGRTLVEESDREVIVVEDET
ncbi:MAG: universal stress protein [Haloarculaceae archaeon]